MRYIGIPIVALTLATIVAGCRPARSPIAASAAPAQRVLRAEEVQATYLSGDGPKTLAEAEGLVVIVQFWATYCDPCLRSFPGYQALLERFEGKLVVLGISVDEPEDGAEQALLKFATEADVRFPLLWDTTGATQQAYRPRHLPTSYVIDREGAVRFVHSSYEAGTREQMATEIESLLSR